MNKSNISIKAGSWYTIGNFIMSGVSFFVTPIYTRLFSHEQYGYYTNFITWQTILFAIISLQLNSTIARAKFDFKGKINSFISTLLMFYLVIAVTCSVVVCVNIDQFVQWMEMPVLYIYLMLGYIVCYPAFLLMQAKHSCFFQYQRYTCFAVLLSVISVCVGLVLSLISGDRLCGRIIGEQITIIIFSLGVYIYLVYKGEKFDKQYIRYAIPIALPLVPHILATNLLTASDRIMIQKICGPQDAGLYGVTYNIGLIVNVLWNSMNQAWAPWFAEQMYNKRYKDIRNSVYKYLGTFLVIVIGCVLVAPELLYFLGGTGYMQARNIIPYVVFACVLQFVYSLYVNIEMYQKKTKYLPVGTGMAAIVNIVLNLWLLPIFGYEVAAITTVVGYFCLYLFHWMIVKYLHLDFVFNNVRIFTIIMMVLLMILLIRLIYDFLIVRYIILVIYVAVIIVTVVYLWKKNKLKYKGE